MGIPHRVGFGAPIDSPRRGFHARGERVLGKHEAAPSRGFARFGLFPGSEPVREVKLDAADDTAISEFAKAGECTIVSTDADFGQLSILFGTEPSRDSSVRRCGRPSCSCSLRRSRPAMAMW